MIAKESTSFLDFQVKDMNFSTNVFSLPKPTVENQLYPSIGVFNYFNQKPVVATSIIPKIVAPVIAPVLPKVVAPILQPWTYTPPVLVQTSKPLNELTDGIVAPTRPTVPKKTISFTVKDKDDTVPDVNIAVNGIATAKTDINGKVTLPNIPINASIKITSVGYDDYVTTASTIPSVVVIKEGTIMLNEVVVQNNYKKPAPKSNTWMWVLGAVGAFGIYKYSNTGSKVVKAKI